MGGQKKHEATGTQQCLTRSGQGYELFVLPIFYQVFAATTNNRCIKKGFEGNRGELLRYLQKKNHVSARKMCTSAKVRVTAQ